MEERKIPQIPGRAFEKSNLVLAKEGKASNDRRDGVSQEIKLLPRSSSSQAPGPATWPTEAEHLQTFFRPAARLQDCPQICRMLLSSNGGNPGFKRGEGMEMSPSKRKRLGDTDMQEDEAQ